MISISGVDATLKLTVRLSFRIMLIRSRYYAKSDHYKWMRANCDNYFDKTYDFLYSCQFLERKYE